MGAGTGLALRSVMFFERVVQFCCAALVLAVYSYFLAALSSHGLPTEDWVRAVEGIAGLAVLYTALWTLAACCIPGSRAVSVLTMLFDFLFAGAFIYVASSNRGGAGDCRGEVSTPFGVGDAETGRAAGGGDNAAILPNLRQACQMETACLAVSIVAIFFFIFSIFTEYGLVRFRRKERRLGPSPDNNYTSGYGKPGFFGGLFGRKNKHMPLDQGSVLPVHTDPSEVRESYTTEQTRIGTATSEGPKSDNPAYGGGASAGRTSPGLMQTGYGEGNPGVHGRDNWADVPLAQYPPANYRYSDGVYDRS